jgi:hypothetical protein
MAFNFLDSQRQSAINFNNEINSVDDFAKQQTSNRLQELANYNNNVNSVLSTVKNFNLTEQQSQFGLQEAYQAGQAALGEKKILDVEAIIGGAMPFVQTAKLLAKLPQAYSQLRAGASKFSDFVSQASSGEGSFIDTAGNAIKQNIGESISEFQGRLADAGAKFVSNVQQTGQNIVDVGQQAISDLRTPANALEELPQDVQARMALSGTETGESAGVEMSQINTTTISNPAFEGEVGELSSGSIPTARILPEQAPTEIASDIPSVAPAEPVVTETAGEVAGEAGAELGGEAIAEAGALAIPGLGEVIGAASLVYGVYEGIKDIFSSSSQAAPPPPPPIEVAPLEEAPSYYTTAQGVANINQSIQSGV